MTTAAPSNCFRRGRRFDGGTADGIVLQSSAGGPHAIDKNSDLCQVIIAITPKAESGAWQFLDSSRRVVNNEGWDVGYNHANSALLFACADNASAASYYCFKGTKDLLADHLYIITFTYLKSTLSTIDVEELDVTDLSLINSETLSISTEVSGGGDNGIVYSATLQNTTAGEANANGLLGNAVSSAFKGTGWAGGAGSNPCNAIIHYIAVRRTDLLTTDAEFFFNELLTDTVPVDATGNATGVAFGAVKPAVVLGELTVTESVSGDPITDTDAYDAGELDTDDTVTVRVTNTGDSLVWIESITNAGGDLGLTSAHTTPRWLYPGGALDLVFTQAGSGGTGGATIVAYGDSGTDTDWADDVATFGEFEIALTYSTPAASVRRRSLPMAVAMALAVGEEYA